MAATSVLEPICQLYRYTGDPRYLAFARFIVDQAWEQPNGPKIISSLLSAGSVFHTANAKAYEMMSDLVGLCELYRLTRRRALTSTPLVAAQTRRRRPPPLSRPARPPPTSTSATTSISRRTEGQGRRGLRHRHLAAIEPATAAPHRGSRSTPSRSSAPSSTSCSPPRIRSPATSAISPR